MATIIKPKAKTATCMSGWQPEKTFPVRETFIIFKKQREEEARIRSLYDKQITGNKAKVNPE